MDDTPQSETQAQERAKKARLSNAFLAVFGSPAKRSESQKLVLSHLAICAADDGNSYRFNEAKDGVALIAAGLHRDGAKSILRVIERQVDIAANAPLPKVKSKTIK